MEIRFEYRVVRENIVTHKKRIVDVCDTFEDALSCVERAYKEDSTSKRLGSYAYFIEPQECDVCGYINYRDIMG